MDVVLGVSVTGQVARLAMIGSPATGGQVLDQYALDLPDNAMTDLADTIVGTYREVTESGNRVVATRLCLTDPSAADTLRQAVSGAGVQNVEVVAEAEAAAALARSVGADAALLLADDDTASLTLVGEDIGDNAREPSTSTFATVPIGAAGAAVACAAVLQQVPAADTPIRVLLVGQRLDLDSVAAELRSTAPVEVAPDAGYAIARGAAQTADPSGFVPAGAATQMAPAVDATQMAPAAADATQMAPVSEATQMAPAAADATQMAPAGAAAAADGVVGPELAYSLAPEDEPWSDEMPMDPLSEFVPEQDDEADYTTVIAPPPPRMLLMSSAVMFLVVSFATLAVTVAVTVRPAADVSAQPPPTQAQTVPGRYLPPVPHEPDPVALPVSVLTPLPAAPVAPNVRSGTNDRPVNQAPPAAPPVVPAPPPAGPPLAPVPVPVPIPIPLPPVIVLPPLNPWTPPRVTPTRPPTTTTQPPTTTTTPPPTTTTVPPTTTTTVPPTTTTTVPPTTPTTTTSVPRTTATTVPPVEEPTYTAPAEEPRYTAPVEQPSYTAPVEAPTYTTPVYPQTQSGGGSSSSGDESSSGGFSRGGSSSSGSSSGSGSGDSPMTTVPLSP